MPSEQPPTRVHECPTCGSPVARASTHPEQSARIVGAALDLLDSLGAPHYHDLIGTTYTLRKEQADNLRAALEPASPTPTEQGQAR